MTTFTVLVWCGAKLTAAISYEGCSWGEGHQFALAAAASERLRIAGLPDAGDWRVEVVME